MPVRHWLIAYTLGLIGLLPAISVAGEEVLVEAVGDGPPSSANMMLLSPAPQSGGQSGAGGASNPAAAPAQPVAVEMPSVKGLDVKGAYWFWIALFGFAGLVCVTCFKNAKRSHNN